MVKTFVIPAKAGIGPKQCGVKRRQKTGLCATQSSENLQAPIPAYAGMTKNAYAGMTKKKKNDLGPGVGAPG